LDGPDEFAAKGNKKSDLAAPHCKDFSKSRPQSFIQESVGIRETLHFVGGNYLPIQLMLEAGELFNQVQTLKVFMYKNTNFVHEFRKHENI
jgi:hypothetical protein